MRLAVAFLALAILSGCRTGEKPFPDAVPDTYYPNGHPIALNAADPLLESREAELVELTNQRRIENGLPPLRRSLMLDALARAHSAHMPIHGFFYGHLNPEGEWPNDRLMHVARSGYIYENLWWVYDEQSMQFVLDGFWGSPDHRANLLSNTDLIGVGMFRCADPAPALGVRVYVVMEFLKN